MQMINCDILCNILRRSKLLISKKEYNAFKHLRIFYRQRERIIVKLFNKYILLRRSGVVLNFCVMS